MLFAACFVVVFLILAVTACILPIQKNMSKDQKGLEKSVAPEYNNNQ
jgi:hypothetical protein